MISTSFGIVLQASALQSPGVKTVNSLVRDRRSTHTLDQPACCLGLVSSQLEQKGLFAAPLSSVTQDGPRV